MRKVLIIGAYYALKPSLVKEMSRSLLSAHTVEVDLRWAAIGVGEPDEFLDRYTEFQVVQGDKFSVLNRLIAPRDLEEYDYLLVIDDDIGLPDGWLDDFLTLASDCEFDICQPARSANSDVGHAFTLQIPGIQARETEFVEVGPVVAVRRSAFGSLVPFDETFPMGWGMECAWRAICGRDGLRMGIIDAFPIEHTFRPTLAHYDRHDTVEAMNIILNERSLGGVFDGQTVLATYANDTWQRHWPESSAPIEISVVITTFNRPNEVRRVLQSLAQQTGEAPSFEVVLVDDGSDTGHEELAQEFRDLLRLTLVTKENSGIASSRNLGLFISRGAVVLFQDDDDYLAPDFLQNLSIAHRERSGERDVILNATELDSALTNSFLMLHSTSSRGGQLYAYDLFGDGEELTPREFWGGRVSVKRRFLIECGVFDARFTWGYEDTELGERLATHGMRVFYAATPRAYSFRQLTLRELLHRSYKQGLALARLVHCSNVKTLADHYGYAFDVRYAIDPEQLEQLATTTERALVDADELLARGIDTDGAFHLFVDELIVLLHRAYVYQGVIKGADTRELASHALSSTAS
jgi:glycosyltransferase involved in cell wall biosynthesis